jgi:hypothetical protein
MAVRYQRARLLIAAGIAASVIGGTGYFAGTVPESSASNTSDGSTSTTVEAPKAPTKNTKAKRSRGS